MNMKIVILSALAFVAVSAAAQAGPAEALAFAIGQCSSQPDEKARLACYDQIAVQLRSGSIVAAPSATPAPPAVQSGPAPYVQVPTPGTSAQAVPPPVASPPPVAQAPQKDSSSWYDPTSWFGKEDPRSQSKSPADFGAEAIPRKTTAAADLAEPEQLDQITANVTSVVYNPHGRFTVTLANGQVWRQLDGDAGSARFKNKGGDVVTISRGILGSYNLVVEGRSALFKVRRVQ